MKSGLIFMIMILIQYIYTSYFKNWSNVMTLYEIKLILFFSESNHSWKYRLFNIQEKLDKQPWNNLFSQKSGILSKRPIHKSWPFIRHKRPTFQFLHSSLINRTPRERKRRWKWQNWTKMWAGRGTRDIIVDAEGWSCEKYIGVCRGDWSRDDERHTGHEKALAYQRGGYAISMEWFAEKTVHLPFTPSNRAVSTHLTVFNRIKSCMVTAPSFLHEMRETLGRANFTARFWSLMKLEGNNWKVLHKIFFFLRVSNDEYFQG